MHTMFVTIPQFLIYIPNTKFSTQSQEQYQANIGSVYLYKCALRYSLKWQLLYPAMMSIIYVVKNTADSPASCLIS